jgi:type II secretory pathway component PulC
MLGNMAGRTSNSSAHLWGACRSLHPAQVVTCLLAAAILAQAVAISRSLLHREGAPGSDVASRLKPVRAWDGGVGAIVAAHLFGQASRPARPGAAGPDLTASAQLQGVVDLASAEGGMAIIRSADGRSHLYHIGQAVGGSAVLSEVHPTYVVLTASTGPVRLLLPVSAPSALTLRGVVSFAPPGAQLTADTETSLKMFGLTLLRGTDGAISGLSGAGAPAWQSSGLLSSDVIVAINGRPISDVLQDPAAVDTAAQAASTVLTVLRDGVEVEIDATPTAAPAVSHRTARADEG